jgi:hypothetical protein
VKVKLLGAGGPVGGRGRHDQPVGQQLGAGLDAQLGLGGVAVDQRGGQAEALVRLALLVLDAEDRQHLARPEGDPAVGGHQVLHLGQVDVDEVAQREVLLGAARDEVDAGAQDGPVGQLVADAQVDLVGDEAGPTARVHAVEAGHARRRAQVGGLPAGVHRRTQDVAQEGPGVLGVLRIGVALVPEVLDPAHAVIAHGHEEAEIDVAVDEQRRGLLEPVLLAPA